MTSTTVTVPPTQESLLLDCSRLAGEIQRKGCGERLSAWAGVAAAVAAGRATAAVGAAAVGRAAVGPAPAAVGAAGAGVVDVLGRGRVVVAPAGRARRARAR